MRREACAAEPGATRERDHNTDYRRLAREYVACFRSAGLWDFAKQHTIVIVMDAAAQKQLRDSGYWRVAPQQRGSAPVL